MATAGKQGAAEVEDVADLGDSGNEAPATSLDCLPPELLLHLFSWLDWRSLITLESVSVRLREAVALHFGRLRLFKLDKSACRELYAGHGSGSLSRKTEPHPPEPESMLVALLSKMVNLRELHVDISSCIGFYGIVFMWRQSLLAAVVSTSRHWPLLERLELTWEGCELSSDLLHQLCASCVRLTSVTLSGDISDDDLEPVLTELPALRTLRVTSKKLEGSFISKLPTDLHNLSATCHPRWPFIPQLRWYWQLLRCHELRSLDLQWSTRVMPDPAGLVSVLVGCVHLERLSLGCLDGAFVACLPPDGLPTLRHLSVKKCLLEDADVGRLVERLPGLESVSFTECDRLTPQGLAPLGRLSSLSVLRVDGPEACVSDWLLTQLSAAPLVELQLPAMSLVTTHLQRFMDEPYCKRSHFLNYLSVDGLSELTRQCKSLKVLTLRIMAPATEVRRPLLIEEPISCCGAGVQERDVEQKIRGFAQQLPAVLNARTEPGWYSSGSDSGPECYSSDSEGTYSSDSGPGRYSSPESSYSD